MATSESDADFESADEELISSMTVKKNVQPAYKKSTVDSESDSDTEYVERPHCGSSSYWTRSESKASIALPHEAKGQKVTSVISDNDNKTDSNVKVHESDVIKPVGDSEKTFISRDNTPSSMNKDTKSAIDKQIVKTDDTKSKVETTKIGIVSTNTRQKASTKLGAKKLGTRISSDKVDKSRTMDNVPVEQQDKCSDEHFVSKNTESTEEKCERLMNDQSEDVNDLLEPEELKSNKKFKEVFELEDWEGLDAQLPDELTEEKLQPVLKKLTLASDDQDNFSASWSNWGNWNVSSLIDTAATSMTTLSTHVSQGLNISKTYISQGLAQDPTETITQDEAATPDDKPEIQEQQKDQSYSSFGLGNLMSGVSSITKLVESTGSKVMTGGLDTLEAIGKKTMEVLQEGDPGLKKKRAFFTNEPEKPILSQILREAKEKAEIAEKTAEERELARQVNFGSLFDDYQGLVHLEVLEILSKQSNLKIRQHLIQLDEKDANSVKETLEEIKELCDLDEEHSDDEIFDMDLRDKLQCACHDLGIDITYEKLHDVWVETENYLASSPTDHGEIFRNAISTLAKFTAFSIERFHKTAELLIIKKRRRTVSEADALVQLTRILSNQISSLAKLFCQTLKQFAEIEEKSDKIKTNVTTTFTEASNANLYIQSAFKLLIPIVQVGAIF
ncbi:protein FAM114A2 [Pseudomyrmex gracilis]|uniref:protein FAM114A2 n=1 Tax=Pseudomyrmex gracilis TaxID=219809 RepID=UPI000994C00B|nr:protein FAM114A2 [Pseudomyrmex gracilis]